MSHQRSTPSAECSNRLLRRPAGACTCAAIVLSACERTVRRDALALDGVRHLLHVEAARGRGGPPRRPGPMKHVTASVCSASADPGGTEAEAVALGHGQHEGPGLLGRAVARAHRGLKTTSAWPEAVGTAEHHLRVAAWKYCPPRVRARPLQRVCDLSAPPAPTRLS